MARFKKKATLNTPLLFASSRVVRLVDPMSAGLGVAMNGAPRGRPRCAARRFQRDSRASPLPTLAGGLAAFMLAVERPLYLMPSQSAS